MFAKRYPSVRSFNPRLEASPFQTKEKEPMSRHHAKVSIPDGKPRPFRLCQEAQLSGRRNRFQSQTGSLALSDAEKSEQCQRIVFSFNPRREASPFQTYLRIYVY